MPALRAHGCARPDASAFPRGVPVAPSGRVRQRHAVQRRGGGRARERFDAGRSAGRMRPQESHYPPGPTRIQEDEVWYGRGRHSQATSGAGRGDDRRTGILPGRDQCGSLLAWLRRDEYQRSDARRGAHALRGCVANGRLAPPARVVLLVHRSTPRVPLGGGGTFVFTLRLPAFTAARTIAGHALEIEGGRND